nr:proline dehydrogenase [Acidobacteriota bacterium]
MLRALFIWLSESKRLRHVAEHSSMGRKNSRRFVAGETLEEVLAATAAVNQLGQGVSIDNLGENVTNAEEARKSAALYHQLLDEMAARKLNANVSLKLTHMGLDVDAKLAEELVSS